MKHKIKKDQFIDKLRKFCDDNDAHYYGAGYPLEYALNGGWHYAYRYVIECTVYRDIDKIYEWTDDLESKYSNIKFYADPHYWGGYIYITYKAIG